MKKFFGVLLTALLILSLPWTTEAKRFGDGYTLEKVVILSRHNLRSPHIKETADLTPHKWFAWTSGSRELSLRGGLSETELGQYFRKYLVDENFMPENYQPAEDEFLFYANSRQRTIATAQYFSSGLLPVANARVKYSGTIEKDRDPIFNTRFISMNDSLRAVAEKELLTFSGVNDPKQLGEKFSATLALMEKALDFKDSAYAKKNNVKNFSAADAKFLIADKKQPNVTGSIGAAFDAADALVLQYYETGTAFGKKFSDKQWKQIGDLVEFGGELVGTPNISVNIARPLIVCMQSELDNAARKFTFLCGHDTNIISVTSALGVEDYSLPETIESRAPIGCKFVVEKWRGRDGQAYAALSMVYPSTKQIRNIEPLTPDNPPKIFPLRLKGLTPNADGLYLFSDVMNRFAETAQR